MLFWYFFLVSGCLSQSYKSVEKASVVVVPDLSQKEIYTKTKQWFSQYFVSGKSVVDYESEDEGTIVGNAGSDTFGLIKYAVKYNIRIDIKDSKFRASTKITGHTNDDGKRTYSVDYVDEKREVMAINAVNKVVSDIEGYVNSKKFNSNKDW